MWMQHAMGSSSRGCVAVVTGASKGLGRELTLALLRRHISVIAVARSADKLEAMRNEALAASLGQAHFFPCVADIATELGMWQVEACLAQTGMVLLTLINNAGTLGPVAPVAGSTLDGWRKHFELNFFAPVELCRRLLPTLRVTGGRIINISSGAATHAYQGWGPYCTSKSALDMLTATIAAEEPNITAISVRPGVMDTDMQQYVREKTRAVMRPDDYEKFDKLHREGKLVHPSKPAYVITRLALEAPREMSGKAYTWDDPDLARFRSVQDAAFSPLIGTASAPGETILPPEFLFGDY